MENNNDVFMLGGHEFHSRFILGSGKYNSHLIRAAVEYADAEIVTLRLDMDNTKVRGGDRLDSLGGAIRGMIIDND